MGDASSGCTLGSASSATTTMWCVAPTSGTVELTITDTDGLTHSATHAVTVSNAVCGATPDPFVDVPATSFADADVTCIYNLSVTTGTSGTTY